MTKQTMDVDAFYQTLDTFQTLEERLRFLKGTDYDVSLDSQPEAILNRFVHLVDNQWDAQRVARVFKKRFNPVAICREATWCFQIPITLMDTIHEECKYPESNIKYYYMRFAFITEGFKRAKDCNRMLLRRLYCLDPRYEDDCDAICRWYDYEEMKKLAIVRDYDLAKFLWSPNRIQKWIEAGNEVEDYLQ